MARVLFIDTWKAGLYYTDAVAKDLGDRHDVHFLHFESLILPYLPAERRSLAFKTYESRKQNDVHYAGIYDHNVFNKSVLKAIEEIQPHVTVFIAVHNFPARWGNLISANKSIPRLHFMHGVNVKYAVQEKANLLKFVKKIYYNTQRALYYSKAYGRYWKDAQGLECPPTPSQFVKEYLELIFQHNKFDFKPSLTHNVQYDTLCLISEGDKAYFQDQYGMDADTRMVVSGHIDLAKMIDKLHSTSQDSGDRKDIVFVSQPYVSSGEIDKSEYVNAIKQLHRIAKSAGMNLIIRLHPREDPSTLHDVKTEGIAFSDKALEEDLKRSACVIGINSTLLSTASQLSIPVLSVRFPHVAPALFLDTYEYHASVRVDQIGQKEGDIKEFLSKALELSRYINFADIKNPVAIISDEVEKLINEPAF